MEQRNYLVTLDFPLSHNIVGGVGIWSDGGVRSSPGVRNTRTLRRLFVLEQIENDKYCIV